jgi:hypothetical protein
MIRFGVVAGVVGLWLSLACTPSFATTGHQLDGVFGGVGSGDGLFDPTPAGLGVLAGDVVAADGRSSLAPYGRVQRFDGAGAFVSSFGLDGAPDSYNTVSALAVDSSGSNAVYVLALSNGGSGGDVLKFDGDGVFAYLLDEAGSGTSFSFDGGSAVAVDPVDGSVYVSTTDGAVARFDGSTGAFVSSFNGSSSPEAYSCPPTSLAVDGAQQVYVLDPCKSHVDRYTAAGVYSGTVDDGGHGVPKAVAIDPVSGEVYVAEAGAAGVFGLGAPHVTQFAAGGGPATSTFSLGGTFGLEGHVGVVGIAVSGTGTVYLADSSAKQVARFVRFDGPTVVTGGPVGDPGPREVTVEGTIDPEGVPSTYHFEYGEDVSGSYGSRTVESDPSSGSDAVPVSAVLKPLKPNKTYHYRLVGTNASGSIYGADQTFTTARVPASVDGPQFVSAIGPRSARLYGTVNPNSTGLFGFGFAVYQFDYGTTAAYGSTVVGPDGGIICFGASCGGDGVSVTAPLSGLLPGTTYHYRVVGDNGFVGPQAGADATFTTAPAAGAGALAVTTRRATLTGTIDPHGEATTYHFNYGPTSSYGARTPETAGDSGDGERVVTLEASGLSPSTTYHVQVVATSGGVIRYGADGLFRTPAAPVATAISPTGVTTGAAMLVGDVDTHGVAGSYHFEVTSLDSSYSSATPELPLPGNVSVERVTAPVEGLPAGETFVVRLSVTSNDSTEVSDLVPFGTAAMPRVFPKTPSGGGAVYGCGVPRLDAYNSRPSPGDTITITGADLGVGGSVVLDDEPVTPAAWSATAFKIDVPEDAAGVLTLTVDCGRRSNTIAITVFHQPVNQFSITKVSVAGKTATLSVRVPGPGKIEAAGARTRAAKVTITRAGTARVKAVLTDAGVRALGRARSHRLRIGLQVWFTPAGGRRATKTITAIYKHKVGR